MPSLDLSNSIPELTVHRYLQNVDPDTEVQTLSPSLQASLLWAAVIVLVIIIICVVVYISVKPEVPTISSSYVSKGASAILAQSSITPVSSVYGSYAAPVETPCLTASGLCTDEGYKTITSSCIPNPTTGYGCLSDDGSQTFETRVQKIGCQPQCREFIWRIESSASPCLLDPPYNDYSLYPCLPSGITGSTTTTSTCVPNDAYGVNSCTYLCGSTAGDDDPSSPNYIPVCQIKGAGTLVTMRNFNYAGLSSLPTGPVNSTQGDLRGTESSPHAQQGLFLAKGYTITSVLPSGMYTITPAYQGQTQVSYTQIQAIDQQLTTTLSCQDASREACGSWAVLNPRNQTTYPCVYQATPDYTTQCETGKTRMLASGLYDPTTLFDFGYTSVQMKCINPNLPGTSPVCLSLVSAGQGPLPLDPTSRSAREGQPCVASLSDLAAPGVQSSGFSSGHPMGGGGGSVNVCTDPSNTNVPGCVQPCIFIAPPSQLDLSGIDPKFRQLIGSYVTLGCPNVSMTSGINFLTLRHVPSSTSSSDSLDPDRQNTDAVFYDCTGDPSKPLNPVRTLLAYSGGDSNGAYWDRAMCSSQAIIQSSSLLLMIKPVTSSAGRLDCNIIGMLGRKYIGWLDIEAPPVGGGSDGLTYLVWKQAKPTIGSAFGDQPTSPRFTISGNADDSYNLSSYGSAAGSVLHSDVYGGSSQGLTGLTLTPLDMSDAALDAYLSTRENRCVANSCDLQFDYIPTLC